MCTAAHYTEDDTRKPLVIDERTFWNEVRREANYHDETPQPLYLDLKTGRVFRAQGEVREAASSTQSAHPVKNHSRYSALPRLSHSDYGQMLEAFLSSDWTPDPSAKSKARAAYSPSVARWMKQVDNPAAVGAFFRYRDTQLKRRLTHYLHCSGIEPEWKN